MMLKKSDQASGEAVKIPPRERILEAASDLFYRQGIKSVGVEAIAETAGTNKMTLYRHFASKDELVAEYLRRLAAGATALWDTISQAHPNDPRAQLSAWIRTMAEHLAHGDDRGCALANAAVEIADKDHPARAVVEEFKCAERDRLARLCAAADLTEPELLADELFLLLEGARVTRQSIGPDGPGCRFVRMSEVIVASHENPQAG